jgi:myo-inositol-1(or 4)-monophosphatase
MEQEKIIKQVEPIIKKAGDILLSYFQQVMERTYKHDGSYATQADVAAENFLIEQLKPLVPGAGFFAEESGKVEGNEYCWVIDPLDGTTNFAQGIPYFCTSIALTKNDEPLLGFIFQPVLQEFFYAIKSGGAFLNGKKLFISKTEKLDQSVIIFAYPYENDPSYFHSIVELNKKIYSARTFGAAALDQAYCAAGRVDQVMFKGLSWWDCAAGMLLITEAGGEISEFNGHPVGPTYRSFLGGNKLIKKKIIQLITY